VSSVSEAALLGAARGGDEDAFARLVAPHRRGLQAHCYRMLGSIHDAEDALQDALLRAWRGLGGLRDEAGLRAWLYRIATNACLREIERRPRRVLPLDYETAGDPAQPLAARMAESHWIEPFPDGDLAAAGPAARYERIEAVELAFVAALQHLPARQRAVLILRDVLGFSAREVGEMLDASPASVDSAMQRARATVQERMPERAGQETPRTLGDERLAAIVRNFVDAWERGDVDALVALLARDAVISMPPIPTWYSGREHVGAFLASRVLGRDDTRRMLVTRANGRPALAQYVWDEQAGRYLPHDVIVLGVAGEEIGEIIAFLDPTLFPLFGLPESVER
jgi:RNA polymerase sigma-70 factor (ECF subfamily)